MKRLFAFSATALLTASLALAGIPAKSTKTVQSEVSQVAKTINAESHRNQPAIAHKMSIKPASTDEVIQVPFAHALTKGAADLSLYDLVDANGDGRSWKIGAFSTYTACMMPNSADVNSADDWLMGPGVELKAGVDYIAQFDFGFMSDTKARLGLFLGTDVTPESMTIAVAEPFDSSVKDMTVYKFPFTVAEDGVYHFGFWACGVRDESFGTIKLANFSVVEGKEEPVEVLDLPAAGTITYTVAPKGELKAHVVYTAPLLTQSGATLEKIDKVEIINRWYEKFEYNDVAPGQVIELDVEMYQGGSNNRFEGIAYINNSKGEPQAGASVLVTGIYAGYDNPLPPTNAKATVSADGTTVTVSWDAPGEVGEHGGYVDVDDITYYIFDAFGSYYDPAIAMTTETSYVFDYSDLEKQDFVAFQITASYQDDNYISLDASTNIVNVGTPDEMPFLESFSDSSFHNMWLIDPESSRYVQAGTVPDNYLQTNADDYDAEPIYLNSQDADNGFHFILPMYQDDLYGLISERISLAGATAPVLEFWYQGKGSALDVLVCTTGDFEVAKTIDLMENPTDGWTLCSVDLKPYVASGSMQFELRLRAIHNDDDHTWSVPFDNIRVYEPKATDLRIVGVAAPSSVAAPASFSINAVVDNFGKQTVENATAVLYREGEKVAQEDVPALAPQERAVVAFEQEIGLDADAAVAFTVEVVANGDEDKTNNSCEFVVKVEMPSYPVPENLNGQLDGTTVILSWDPVDISELTEAKPVTDSFEDYDVFTIDNFGDWMNVDLDGLPTYTIFNDVNNPYRCQPMAFQVFNPYLSGMPSNYYEDAEPHTGDAMLVAWSAQGYNCNMLVTPELSGEEQTISFWAKSMTIAFPETIAAYYSTTDANLNSFEECDAIENYDGVAVPEDWTEFKVAVPAGTKYFALLHDAYDSYALYVDDFTYTPAAMFSPETVVMYNVYRDGSLLDTTSEPTYYDEILTPVNTTYSYRVSAKYDALESRHSDPVKVLVNTVGVENVTIGNDVSAEYFNLQGIRVNNPEKGLYIKRQGGNVSKVVR